MIFDDLSRFSCYRIFKPETAALIMEVMAGLTPETPDGRIDIGGDALYATVAAYETKEFASALVEAHRDYCDIQLLLGGEEDIFLADPVALDVAVPYKPDIIFYRTEGACWSSLHMKPGKFAVFFPGEGHMPGIDASVGRSRVRKVVFKVALDRLEA